MLKVESTCYVELAKTYQEVYEETLHDFNVAVIHHLDVQTRKEFYQRVSEKFSDSTKVDDDTMSTRLLPIGTRVIVNLNRNWESPRFYSGTVVSKSVDGVLVEFDALDVRKVIKNTPYGSGVVGNLKTGEYHDQRIPKEDIHAYLGELSRWYGVPFKDKDFFPQSDKYLTDYVIKEEDRDKTKPISRESGKDTHKNRREGK